MVDDSRPKPEEELIWNINNNPDFAAKIISDYDVARGEFEKAGITIDANDFNEFRAAFTKLNEASKKVFGPAVLNKPKWIIIFAPPWVRDDITTAK